MLIPQKVGVLCESRPGEAGYRGLPVTCKLPLDGFSARRFGGAGREGFPESGLVQRPPARKSCHSNQARTPGQPVCAAAPRAGPRHDARPDPCFGNVGGPIRRSALIRGAVSRETNVENLRILMK